MEITVGLEKRKSLGDYESVNAEFRLTKDIDDSENLDEKAEKIRDFVRNQVEKEIAEQKQIENK